LTNVSAIWPFVKLRQKGYLFTIDEKQELRAKNQEKHYNQFYCIVLIPDSYILILFKKNQY